jgi:hypothetical protein
MSFRGKSRRKKKEGGEEGGGDPKYVPLKSSHFSCQSLTGLPTYSIPSFHQRGIFSNICGKCSTKATSGTSKEFFTIKVRNIENHDFQAFP